MEKNKPWTKQNLLTVLKSLKKGKARDLWGLSNDILNQKMQEMT